MSAFALSLPSSSQLSCRLFCIVFLSASHSLSLSLSLSPSLSPPPPFLVHFVVPVIIYSGPKANSFAGMEDFRGRVCRRGFLFRQFSSSCRQKSLTGVALGGFRLKPHIEVRFKWMWFPIGIFQSPNFWLREGSKKTFDTASSRGLAEWPYRRFDSEIWFRSDDVQGRKDRRRYRRLSAICCLQRCLARRQLLKLQSRTADKKNPWRKRRIWRGRSTTSPVQRSTKTGAILFGVANWVHIHLKPTSMCGINFVLGGGGGVYRPFEYLTLISAYFVVLLTNPPECSHWAWPRNGWGGYSDIGHMRSSRKWSFGPHSCSTDTGADTIME